MGCHKGSADCFWKDCDLKTLCRRLMIPLGKRWRNTVGKKSERLKTLKVILKFESCSFGMRTWYVNKRARKMVDFADKNESLENFAGNLEHDSIKGSEKVKHLWLSRECTGSLIPTRFAVLCCFRPRIFSGLGDMSQPAQVRWLESANHCPFYCKQCK